MKNLKKFLLTAGITTSLLAGQTFKQAKAQNYDTYIKNYSSQEDLTIDYLEKNNDLGCSLLKKNQDSLVKKVKSFIRMTKSEVNSRKTSTENYTRGLNLNHKNSVKSYIERCQKDSAYVKSVLNQADSLKLSLEVHYQLVKNALMIDLKKSRGNSHKAVAEFKVAKDTLSEEAKQQRKLILEKIDKKLDEDEVFLISLKNKSEDQLSELNDYTARIPNRILDSYLFELVKSRELLVEFEAKENKEQEKAEKNKK